MNKFIICWSVLACVIFASATEVVDESDNYILGARNAPRYRFPWLISLRNVANQHFCGGFIISRSWVGTAATCTQGTYRNPKNIIAVVGAHTRTDGTRHTIETVVNHPRYNARTRTFDISVMKTTNTIVFLQPPQKIRMVFFPRGPVIHDDSLVMFAGWGYTQVFNQQIYSLKISNITS